MKRVVAAENRRHEVVRVERQAVDRADEHAFRRRAAVHAGADDERRLRGAQVRRLEAEREVVADVRVLQVEQQPIADHPLVAELVGRVRPGVPEVLAEALVDRLLRRGGLDRVQVGGAAGVPFLLVEVVEDRQLVALEQLHFALEVGLLQQRAIGVQTGVDVFDRRGERDRRRLVRLAVRGRLVEADHADVDRLLAEAAPHPGAAAAESGRPFRSRSP